MDLLRGFMLVSVYDAAVAEPLKFRDVLSFHDRVQCLDFASVTACNDVQLIDIRFVAILCHSSECQPLAIGGELRVVVVAIKAMHRCCHMAGPVMQIDLGIGACGKIQFAQALLASIRNESTIRTDVKAF